MKILLCSHVFAPSIGGTETVGRLLAQEFAAAGHEARVVTESPGESTQPFPVQRCPTARELRALVRWADIVFHNNISLRAAWPLLLARKPWFITHHTWISGPMAFAKRFAARFASNIAISSAIAEHLTVPSRTISDPYDANLFHVRRGVARTRDLLFVGRLVSDKGCDLLLDALDILRGRGNKIEATVIGDGPDRAALEGRASARFLGSLEGEELARVYNEHRVLVIPSRWNEPFGVVALEGIACGCIVVGSSGGGLSEAIGRCGLTFPNGDAAILADTVESALRQDPVEFTRHAEAHLKRHHPAVIAQKYLDLFAEAIK